MTNSLGDSLYYQETTKIEIFLNNRPWKMQKRKERVQHAFGQTSSPFKDSPSPTSLTHHILWNKQATMIKIGSGSRIIDIDDLYDALIRIYLRPALIHIQKEFLAHALLQRLQLLPKKIELLAFQDIHDAHRTAYLLSLQPLQFAHVLARSIQHLFQLLRTLPSLMGVQIAEISVLGLEKQMRVSRGASHNGKEIIRSHHLGQSIQVLLLSLIQADSGHDQYNYIFLFSADLVEEDGVIVTNRYAIGQVEVLEGAFDDESSLAWSIPLKFLFMGVKRLRNIGQSLQRKRHLTVIPEERGDGVQLGCFFLEKQVSDGHLGHSKHASPP